MKQKIAWAVLIAFSLFQTEPLFAKSISLSARAAIIVDVRSGRVLYSKNPHLRLPPASTTKVMTALIALEKLPLKKKIRISRNAVNASPSKAGLTLGAKYTTKALIIASLVASSNDAAVALAEACAGSEEAFARMMNAKAKKFGMKKTHFINSTGLPIKGRKQYTTAQDLTILMRRALKDKRIDEIMGLTKVTIGGTDGKQIELRSHNKMLWRKPGLVKGKTGWTFASRHTFVGTNYSSRKQIAFAMLSSKEPWIDIERLAKLGLSLVRRN